MLEWRPHFFSTNGCLSVEATFAVRATVRKKAQDLKDIVDQATSVRAVNFLTTAVRAE
jgi:hypothetical protein